MAQSQYIHDHARAPPVHKARTTSRSAVEKRLEVPCNIFSHLACEKGRCENGLRVRRTLEQQNELGSYFHGRGILARVEKRKRGL